MNSPLQVEFDRVLEERGWFEPGARVVVAVSGGLDSVVLFDLLRTARPDLRLVVGHFDHGMRPDSAADAQWVERLAADRGGSFRTERADGPLSSEAAARSARYAALERIRADVGADWIVTAHHADDQAETVLHRVLRGTGPDGLAGIRESRGASVVRPLLGFHRSEIEAHAQARGLEWREDPTNADGRLTRNWIRHELLPVVDARMGQAARRALARLAENAAEDARAWEELLLEAVTSVVERRGESDLDLDVERFVQLPAALQSRLLRRLATDLEGGLERDQVERVMDVVAGAAGREYRVGGVTFHRSREHLHLSKDRPAEDSPAGLRIESHRTGRGELVLGGSRHRFRWGATDTGDGLIERFDAAEVVFPATIRGWQPGDRVQAPYGTKKLKKLFQERGVPGPRRPNTPVLVDARDRVLWVPGLVRSTLALPRDGDRNWTIALEKESR